MYLEMWKMTSRLHCLPKVSTAVMFLQVRVIRLIATSCYSAFPGRSKHVVPPLGSHKKVKTAITLLGAMPHWARIA